MNPTSFFRVKPIFSCGKNLAAIVVARLVDQSLLRYDAQVTDYWPEFAKNGKGGENIKVSDVLRHECALSVSLRHHKVQITTKAISECAEIKCPKKVARVTKYQYFLLLSAKTKAK